MIAFDAAECFIDKYSTTNPKTLGKFGTYVTPPADKQLTALRVQIPPNGKQDVKKAQFFSPCPSPTGTMRYGIHTHTCEPVHDRTNYALCLYFVFS